MPPYAVRLSFYSMNKSTTGVNFTNEYLFWVSFYPRKNSSNNPTRVKGHPERITENTDHVVPRSLTLNIPRPNLTDQSRSL